MDKVPIKLDRKRLDDAGVATHLEALAASAEAIEIRVKGGATDYSDAAGPELAEVARRLLAGEVLAVQVRFFADGDWWCDTITRRGDTYRLVRMRQG